MTNSESGTRDLTARTPRTHVGRAPRKDAMAAADLPGSDEERAEAALIAAAGQLLGDSHREIPADFVAGLFAHAVPEDLMRYDPRSSPSSLPTPGRCSRCASLARPTSASTPSGRGRSASVGAASRCSRSSTTTCRSWSIRCWRELAERGVDVRFVVHPVFTVERDAGRPPHRLQGARRRRPARCARASSTSMSSAIDDAARRAEIVAAIEQVLADVRACVADWRAMIGARRAT